MKNSIFRYVTPCSPVKVRTYYGVNTSGFRSLVINIILSHWYVLNNLFCIEFYTGFKNIQFSKNGGSK
jgi:hypothetical protein